MVHLGLGGQFLQEGDSAYLFPANRADVETQSRKIVSFSFKCVWKQKDKIVINNLKVKICQMGVSV